MKNIKRVLLSASVLLVVGALVSFYTVAQAEEMFGPSHCTGVIVGKSLTADGSVLIGQTGDESSSHWVDLVPRMKHEVGEVIDAAGATEIPQVPVTNKYISFFYSVFWGLKSLPLENGGINEYQVSCVDVWQTAARKEIEEEAKPWVENRWTCKMGLSYRDSARVVMQRAKTAKEGVRIIGNLVEKYGVLHTNAHPIADPNEGWIVLEFPGPARLWVAKRVSDDEIAFSRDPIVIPLELIDTEKLKLKENSNYMSSPNLISYAVEKGWYDSESGEPFNIRKIYEAPAGEILPSRDRWVDNEPLKEILREVAPHITPQDVMKMFRSHYEGTELFRTTVDGSPHHPDALPNPVCNDYTRYCQVAQLRSDVPNFLGVLWSAPSQPCCSIFVPFYIGITKEGIPTVYKKHVYATEDPEESNLLYRVPACQESTRYAWRIFHRLYQLVDQQYNLFHPGVIMTFEAFEDKEATRQKIIEETALQLYKTGKEDLARKFLTSYCYSNALDAFRLAEIMANDIEERTRVLFGFEEERSQR